MSSDSQQWLPYLGDAVNVRVGNGDLIGATTRFDAALVEVADVDAHVGDTVEAAWRVGPEVHRCVARVEAVHPGGISVRLASAPVQASRRAHERVILSVPVVVCATQHGSFGASPRDGRTLDFSDAGLRAIIDTGIDSDAVLGVGEAVRVEVELGGRVEILQATVVWENPHGAHERVAGLAFAHAVDTAAWRGLSQHRV